MPKAMIAMSGGVDSSVAAYLTLAQGLDCCGGMMQLHKTVQQDGCGSLAHAKDAQAVAQKLGIPFHLFDFSQQFEECVIRKFANCYENGETPNPCVDCNRHLKFEAFLQQALSMGCDTVVTGHYAKIQQDPATGRYLLKKAADADKDQSYFLYTLTQKQLQHIQFPLGFYTKQQIREIAREQGFITAQKKDSQDICFIPDGDYLSFLQRYHGRTYPQGAFLNAAGNVVGTHKGAVGYTLGQRKGLGIALGEPVYVCDKNMKDNTVTVGPEALLYHSTLRAKDWNFFPFSQLSAPMEVKAKTRSRQKEQPAWVYPEDGGFARVKFATPQRAITPGQAVVLYDGDTVIGGGTITEAF